MLQHDLHHELFARIFELLFRSLFVVLKSVHNQACVPWGVLSIRGRYHKLIVSEVGLMVCKTVCIRKMTKRGLYFQKGNRPAIKVGGVGEEIRVQKCAVSIWAVNEFL